MQNPKIFFPAIERAVCAHYRIAPADIQQRRRCSSHAFARHALVLLARQHTALSSSQIGERIHRDHSSALGLAKRAAALESYDAEFQSDLVQIRLRLLSQLPPAPPPPVLTREEQVRAAWRASLARVPAHLVGA